MIKKHFAVLTLAVLGTLSGVSQSVPAGTNGAAINKMVTKIYIDKKHAKRPSFCASGKFTWLRTKNGKVVSTSGKSYDLFSERSGFAEKVTGGRGGYLRVVKTLKDAPALKSSLRSIIDNARRTHQPVWVVFDPKLRNGTIRLSSELKLPNNITVDGTCSNITLTSDAHNNLFAIRATKNIIITGFKLTKNKYDDLDRRTRDAISVIGAGDQVWIHRNLFKRCGDGCVDVASKTRPGRDVRVTISNNIFSNHNKVMLVGSLVCSYNRSLPGCQTKDRSALGDLAVPKIFVTVKGNLFYHTSQRHPKVYSHGFAEVSNNVFLFDITKYKDGRVSAVYGTGADRGGSAVVSENVFSVARSLPNPVRATYNVGTGSISVGDNSRALRGFAAKQGGTSRSTESLPGAVKLKKFPSAYSAATCFTKAAGFYTGRQSRCR
jgi:pectate lyase